MTVRYYPPVRTDEGTAVARFLRRYRVKHELMRPEDLSSAQPHLYRVGEVPAVEVDGKLFVNPNDDALRKILKIA